MTWIMIFMVLVGDTGPQLVKIPGYQTLEACHAAAAPVNGKVFRSQQVNHPELAVIACVLAILILSAIAR